MWAVALTRAQEKSHGVAPVAEFFGHIADARKLYRAPVDSGRIHAFFDLAEGYFARGIARRLKEMGQATRAQRELEARSHALPGNLLSLLKSWLDRGAKEPQLLWTNCFIGSCGVECGNLRARWPRVRQSTGMDKFPEFMQHPANRIASTDQATPGVEGYVFDGADGSQMAFWTCKQTARSAAHRHDYDEYVIVVQGSYTLMIEGRRIPLNAGDEYLIERGTLHGGEVVAGTRTIHCFGGHRANRVGS